MARFVSPHRNLYMGVRAEKAAYLGPDGVMVPGVTELGAQFTPDLRTDEDTEFAKSTFTFRGLPIWENGQTIDPFFRISVFDSEVAKLQAGWTDDDEALVVDTLRNGPIGTMYAELLPVPAEKPWNGYDELSDADRIVELAVAIGSDLNLVAKYESENQNRQDVIEALQAALASADETIIVSA